MTAPAQTTPEALFAPGLSVFPGAAAERGELEGWNRADAPFPADGCIHRLFEEQAARTPGAVAAVCAERSLTYAELNARANRLAHHLAALGVGPEVRVGIGLRRGLEMLVSILAVLKAGGAYVPLDPAYPAERLAFTLRDARVAVLLTQESLRAVLPVPAGVRVVSVDLAADELARESAADPRSVVGPRNLAYLIYTSGSTGVPKGVAIEHGSAVALLSWAAGVYTADELAGTLACTSICFDLSIFELFLPLSMGGRVIMVENALALPRAAAADQVRLLNTVPSAAAALLASGGIPAGVTTVNLAGEPLRAALVDALYAHGVLRVYDLYGPSEDTTYSTWTLRRPGGPETIGRPIAHTWAYVLDEAMRPVPAGEPGELYLGGKGVTRGYLGRPALTAERYLPDPHAAAPGGRLYRTGDRARWNADGTLAYLGRLDAQVKIRGFRIELGEIEAALRLHPSVRDCVVVARPDAEGEKRLAAYVVGPADAEGLRAHLRRSLPEPMVPAAFVAMEALPLTPNGKLDRKALPAPVFGSAEDRYVAPRTPVETVLAGIWAELLRVERVGVHDGFLELGGHSLLGTRVVSRIREALGVELTAGAVFELPTVAALAGRVEALRQAGAPPEPPLAPVERTDALPLSFAQQGLWFLDRLQPGSAFYNVPAAVRLSGPLDAPALERALGQVVRRHEPLRTRFAEVDGAPVQVVDPFRGFTLPVEDLSALPAAEREAEARRRAGDDASRPFDLAAGPLFRAALLRLAADEHVLLVAMHHAVTDGWSLELFFAELSALYAAGGDAARAALPPLPVRYADYAGWQRARLAGEAPRRELAYWRERLAGAPALLELPTDRPRPAVQSFRGARERVELPAALLARLEAVGRAEGATLYMVLLGAFQLLLSRHAGSDDVVVGSPVAGRTRRELEGLIGLFVNTLVLRTDLSGDPTFRALLGRVRQATLGAYDHQELPFDRLVEELHPERSLSHAPLFQVMFALDDAAGVPERVGGLEARRVEAEHAAAKFDLTLSLEGDARGMRGVLEYATDLFDRATIRRMLRHLRRVLEQVADDVDVRLSRVRLLDEAERRTVVAEWNRTDAPAAGTTLHGLFEAQAERTPEAAAVVCAGARLGYGELEARANRLANHLRRRGVGPEVRVAVCLEPGPEMIVSVLAVLKAGGAYVPLDPASPAERLRAMLGDAGVAVLVTEESLRGRIPSPGVDTVSVDGDRAGIAAEPATRPVGGAMPGSLAYVIYTSGSTGVPKGVAVEHRGACNLVPALVRLCGVDPGTRALLLAPLHFDASVAEIFSALAAGAALHLPDAAAAVPGDALVALLRRERITHTKLTPSALGALPAAELPDLRTLVVGGEACTADLVARWGRGRRFVNVYGPTEATVRVSAAVCVPEPRHPSLGAPLANTRLYVLDPSGEPAPVGVAGELHVGGVQLARGYLGRPALTAERFVPDPFGGAPGRRLYRTGDRARWRADGVLEYLGRLDAQVKVRGFRIEPGEIESVLRRHPDVRECAVVARDDAPGGRRLVAYVVGGCDPDALRAHLRRSVPEYMVPAAFVALGALPLTPNGKVDRRALPAPDFGAPAERYVAPRTPVEEALAAIWAEVLGVARVGVHDGFFELGGHSLLATRLVWRIQDALDGEVSVLSLFETPTIAGLAPRLAVRRARPAAEAAAAPASSQQLLAMIDQLSDAELDRLLGANPENRTFP